MNFKQEEQRRAITVKIDKSLSSTTTVNHSEEERIDEFRNSSVKMHRNKPKPEGLQTEQTPKANVQGFILLILKTGRVSKLSRFLGPWKLSLLICISMLSRQLFIYLFFNL